MHGSATVGWLLAALCALTATACLLRARGAAGMPRRTAVGEAVMGLGMAAMALPGGVAPTVPAAVFVVLFSGLAGWELTPLRELRQARHAAAHLVHHLVGCGGMVYMALTMAGVHGGAVPPHAPTGSTVAGSPLLTGALLAYFAVYVLLTGSRLLPAAATAGGHAGAASGCGRTVLDLPALATACRLAMGTGMFAMLLTL